MVTRRQFQAGLMAAPALLALRARAEAQTTLDVAIIGAGAAGLVAAHRAREKGLTTRIFEARTRVGGRVYTDETLGPGFEAGAFYIHFAERNPWRGIAEAQGVALVNDDTLSGGFNVFRDGRPIPPEERGRRRGAFGRLSDAVDAEGAGADFSFAEAAQRLAPDLFEAAQSLTLLSLGEEPENVSVRDYQQLDSGDDLVVPSGYGHILARHAQGLDIALATPVSAIDTSGAAVRLTTPGGEVLARTVVLTVPIGVLQAGAIRFTPALPPATLAAINGLGMGALTKVALKFEGTRFGLNPWAQFFDQGTTTDKGPPDDLVNFEFWPFDRDLVVAMFGGNFARGLVAAGEAAAVEAILARLTRILGEDTRKAFRAGRLAGWSADPFALGGYSIAKPGQAAARTVLEAPIQGRLWLAGEANAGIASMTAGGAAIAGRRAVDDAAQWLASGGRTGNGG
ncbi:MAG: amine oxidase [Rhizobiales bacterium PAR1]|nr:MAG: amine oxidase [Rhizobiales bacterium PAR1]